MRKWILLMACLLTVFAMLSVSIAESGTPAISLDSASVTLVKGKTAKLKPVTQNIEKSVRLKFIWESSDENVVKVTNGTLKAIDGGRATVTCSAEMPDGTALKATAEVVVTVPVTALKLTSPNTMTIHAGQIGKVQYTLAPDNATDPSLEWTSSDETVAAVDGEGVIHAKTAGTAKITAVTRDGSKRKIQMNVYVPSLRCAVNSVAVNAFEGASVEIDYYGDNWDKDVTVKQKGNAFTFSVTGGNGKYTVRLLPVSGGAGTLTVSSKKDPVSKIVLNVTVSGSAIRENQYILLTEATCNRGNIRFSYVNNCGADIEECTFAVIPYNAANEQIWYFKAPGTEPRFYTKKDLLKAGARTSVSAWIGADSQDKTADHVDIAVDSIKMADGRVITLPDAAHYWYSTKEKAYLARPEGVSGDTRPEESVLKAAKEFRVGYSSTRVREWMKEHYGFRRGGELVVSVAADSIAEKGGLRAGDLIISVDGVKTTEDPYNAEKGIAKIAEGQSIVFTVERAGETDPVDLVFSGEAGETENVGDPEQAEEPEEAEAAGTV